MNIQEALDKLNTQTFEYVLKKRPTTNSANYETYFLNNEQFEILLPKISGCGLTSNLEENVAYVLEREHELIDLRADDNGNPYCTTWWCCDCDGGIEFGYETTSGTIVAVIHKDNSTTFKVELPCKRSGGHHAKLISMVLAGATARLIEINRKFYAVEEAAYYEFANWWNSTDLGDSLPSWDEWNTRDQARTESWF